MAVVDNDYAAYIETENGEYPLRDLGAVRADQGSENARKVMGIGDDGIVTPVDAVEASIQQKTMTAEDTTVTLNPDTFYVFPEMTTLTVTLGSGESGKASAFWFCFDSGDTATTLSLPESVVTDIVVEANTHYECMIVNNHMTFYDWPEVTA